SVARGPRRLAAESRRVALSLRAKGEPAIERLIVSGEGAKLSGLGEALAKPAGLISLPLDLSSFREKGKKAAPAPPSEHYSPPLGLAMLRAERQRALSTRQGPFAFKGAFSRLAGQILKVAVLLLALLALAGVTSYARYRTLAAQEKRATDRLAKVTKVVTGKDLSDIDAIDDLIH